MAQKEHRKIDNELLLILVGLTGTGKTTAVNALRDRGCRFLLLPNRRDLTNRLIIEYLQQLDGEPVAPVQDRTERFNYTRRYREMYPGGMAYAVGQLLMANSQLSIVNNNVNRKSLAVNRENNDDIRHAEYGMRIFDGLRGENEVTYAAQNIPNAWFLFLDAPDFVRVQRLLRRNDRFDKVKVNGNGETACPEIVEEAVSLDPTLTNWLDDQQLAQLEFYIRTGELTPENVHAKLTIVQKERQNYDPDATLAALHQHAPDRLIYADTVANSAEEIAQQVIDALAKVVTP